MSNENWAMCNHCGKMITVKAKTLVLVNVMNVKTRDVLDSKAYHFNCYKKKLR